MTFYGCTQVTYRSLLLSINRKRLNCYSMLFLIISRIKLLFSAPFIRALDNKFGDQADDLWLHHTSKPLEDTISKYSKDSDDNKKLKIATNWNKRQPRLLVVSADVIDGKTVTEAEDPKNPLYECDGIL